MHRNGMKFFLMQIASKNN
uniref:Uncharacterized protein n=1 Tax=Rhizophora mucronata TaxID=61149 RepID=A0A2P2QF94_RHIMU